ncbi:hypothetical protein D3C76_1665890 [compost metagenome]
MVKLESNDFNKEKDVDYIINKLDKLGCKVNKIRGEYNLNKILYECINKKILIGDKDE